MGTTTKMAIPYPEATGLVKDGWEDMKDIATQVDAKSGLIYISTTTFTGVASASLPTNTFTSNFRNYRIIVEATGASASGNFSFRLRTSGTDNSNANYQLQLLEGFSTSVTATRTTNATNWQLFSITTNKNFFIFDLIAPQAVDPTITFVNSSYATNSTTLGLENYALGFNANTQFDSFTIFSTGANITGTLTVFGYNA